MPQKSRKNHSAAQVRTARGGGYSNYPVYSGARAANAGVMDIPGRVRDAGRYRERIRENEKFPNRRRRIITGKELTTPLRKKGNVTVRKKSQRKIAAEEKIRIKVRTISVEKKKFPVSAFFCIFILTFFLLWLICSQIVLNEKNMEINMWNEKIAEEEKRGQTLGRALDNKTDLSAIMDYAVNRLGMIKEDLLQKHYISYKIDDKVEVMENKNSVNFDFPKVMSSLLGK